MKSSTLFFILVSVVSMLFIASCNKNQQNSDEDAEFKNMCRDSGYEWMLMKPTKDGKFIKDSEACWGCMVEGFEMVCDKEKFRDFAP